MPSPEKYIACIENSNQCITLGVVTLVLERNLTAGSIVADVAYQLLPLAPHQVSICSILQISLAVNLASRERITLRRTTLRNNVAVCHAICAQVGCRCRLHIINIDSCNGANLRAINCDCILREYRIRTLVGLHADSQVLVCTRRNDKVERCRLACTQRNLRAFSIRKVQGLTVVGT